MSFFESFEGLREKKFPDLAPAICIQMGGAFYVAQLVFPPKIQKTIKSLIAAAGNIDEDTQRRRRRFTI